jgi:8-oxo-dGTP pyrophosphatase MutT (NUDIX family)
VVYRHRPEEPGGELEIALAARRTRKGDLAWGLPKGNIEPGESREEAAVREVREESGLEAVVEAPLGDSRYFYVWEGDRVRKVVHFFLMRATGGDIRDHDYEMEEVRWFPLADALSEASYSGEREVLRRAAERLAEPPPEAPEPEE